MSELSKEQKLLLDLISAALHGKQPNIPANVDWVMLMKECKNQSVSLLVFPQCEKYLPKEVRQQWSILSRLQIANGIRVEWEHGQLHHLMEKGHIPYVVMKGCASAAYYPDPSLRAMGDVDFLVAREDLERAGKILVDAGFTQHLDSEENIHIAYHRSEGYMRTVWEMHWEPNGVPDGEAGAKIHRYLDSAIADARLCQTSTAAYMGPTPFHHGLVMLLHTATHLINTGVGLRHLCDWAVFAEKLSDEEFYLIFEEKLKMVGLWRFAQLLTQLSVRYLGCPPKVWMGELDEPLLAAMIGDVFSSGNFGCKDAQRINQAKLMTNKKRGTVDDTSFLMQFVHTMNEKAQLGMPICQKWPVLLPVGWCFVGVRHSFRILIGKRPRVDVGEMVSGANERREIYKKLALFVRK